MNNKKIYIPFLLVLFLLTSCVKRELELLPGERVRIAFDWTNLNGQAATPSCMQIWFYGPDNIPLSRMASGTLYEGVLPAGTYRVLCYCPEATGVNFKNLDRFEEAEVYLLPDEQGSMSQPANVYGFSLPEFTVSPGQLTDTTVRPEAYVRTILLRMKVSGNQAGAVSGIGATLKGVATSLNLSTGKPQAGGNASLEQTLSGTDSDYEGIFTLIGNDSENPGLLTLKLSLSDGSERTVSENITEAMQHLEQIPATVALKIDLTLDLTKIDGVFVGTIREWTYKEGEITVN